MTKRTDTHRPSAIIPAEYEFVCYGYMGRDIGALDIEAVSAQRKIRDEHFKRTGGTFSHHEHGGNCHICGAACKYDAIFYHKPTNSYIRTGLECADKVDASIDGALFRKVVKQGLEARAGKKKAALALEARGLDKKVEAVLSTPPESKKDEEYLVQDLHGRLVKYGVLSDKQWAFMGSLLTRIEKRQEWALKREAEKAAAKPVPKVETRMEVRGEIVSIKQGMFGEQMLIKTPDGWMAFGAVPADLQRAGVTRGQKVKFMALVKVSDKDEKFAFFKRPTKAFVMNLEVA